MQSSESNNKRDNKKDKLSKTNSKTKESESGKKKGTKSSPIEYKLLDSGTYGCVVTPPFDKKNIIREVIMPYKNKKNSDIAKIYKRGKEDFAEEVELIEKVQKIDPKNKFTTKMKGAMVLIGDEIENATIQNCLIEKKKISTYDSSKPVVNYMNDSYYQLILENGGERTDKTYSLTYPDFISKFRVFIEGMLKLQEHNFVHLDIKPANVLISDDKINLIDFGLMTRFNELFTKENQHILEYSHVYPYYPPEFYLAQLYLNITSIFAIRKDILDRWEGKMIQDDISKYLQQSFVNKSIDLRKKYENGVQKLFEIIRSKVDNGIVDASEIFPKEMAKKTDVFSISYIIAALAKNIIFSKNDVEKRNQQEFIEEIYQKCFEPNPYDRTSMKELYDIINKEYKSIAYNSSSKSSNKSSKNANNTKTKSNSKSSTGGYIKLKKACSMVPKYMLRIEMDKNFKQKALDIKKGKISL